jgi:ABC-type lipoprotein export system ATPase subunit
MSPSLTPNAPDIVSSDRPLLLSARQVWKSYQIGHKKVDVLRGVDLAVCAGDFVALRGASGAGKSTLLHLLGGLDMPNQGEVRFEGESLTQLSPAALSRFRNTKIGFVFQAYHLLPELDALENVCLPARITRLDPVKTEARGRLLLSRVGLADRMDHLPAELSGGEQQRVAIARALINEPALLLADEPTGNLDSHTGEEIIGLLASLWSEQKTTLIIATHDTQVAQRAPLVIQLADGIIVSAS